MLALPTLRAASGSTFRTSAPARYNSTQAGSGSNASYGSATRSTVPPRSTHATYHPDGYGISEGLKRARKPYRVRNILTGSLIMGFATSVYFYSISKVRAFMAARHFAISILTHRSSLLCTVHCCTGQARRLLGSCRDQGARRHRLNTCHYRGGSQAQSMIRQVSMQRNTECHYSIFIRGPEILPLRCLSPAARCSGII